MDFIVRKVMLHKLASFSIWWRRLQSHHPQGSPHGRGSLTELFLLGSIVVLDQFVPPALDYHQKISAAIDAAKTTIDRKCFKITIDW